MINSLGLTLKEYGRSFLMSEAAPEVDFEVFNMQWIWFPGDQYSAASLYDTVLGNISPTTTANGADLYSVIMYPGNSTAVLVFEGIVGTPFLQCRIGGMQFRALDASRFELNGNTEFSWDWSEAVSGTQDIFGVSGEGGTVDTFEIQELT